MGKEGDISANAPESSAITVDQIDLELSPLLDRLLTVGGQSVDR